MRPSRACITDGVTWWYLKGYCHQKVDGKVKGMFKFDFSPKGGPSELVADWDHFSKIKFPDGNVWYKPEGPGTQYPSQEKHMSPTVLQPYYAPTAIFALLVALFVVGAVVARKGRKATALPIVEQL